MIASAARQADWVHHRGPCHVCRVCGVDQCLVYGEDTTLSRLHLCAYGCDGVTWWAWFAEAEAA
jgi:hypothetical protein